MKEVSIQTLTPLEQSILAYLKEDCKGVASLSEIKQGVGAASVPEALARLLDAGLVERLRRGVYRHSQADHGLYPEFVEAIAQAPHAAIGLLSALAYHGLSTVIPDKVYLIQPKTARVPRIDWPRTIIVKTTPATFEGIIRMDVGEAQVPMTEPAKTVADCWKHRKMVGTEIAIEALRDYLRRPGASLQLLRTYAAHDRVLNVMTPYIESMLP